MLYTTNWYSKLLCDISSLNNKNKKVFFLIYSLISNIKKSQIGHLYQSYHFQSCSRNSSRWTPYPAWNLHSFVSNFLQVYGFWNKLYREKEYNKLGEYMRANNYFIIVLTFHEFILASNDGTSADSNFMTILFPNGTRQSLLAILFEITIIFSHCIKNLPYFSMFTIYTGNWNFKVHVSKLSYHH